MAAAQHRLLRRASRGALGSQGDLCAPEQDVTRTERTVKAVEAIANEDAVVKSRSKFRSIDANALDRTEVTAEDAGTINVRPQSKPLPKLSQQLPHLQRPTQQAPGRQKVAPAQLVAPQQRTRAPPTQQQWQQQQQRQRKSSQRNQRKRDGTPKKKRR